MTDPADGVQARKTNTLAAELLYRIDAYWRAANHLSVGQIYLFDNLLLKRPLPRQRRGHDGGTPAKRF